MVFFYVLMMSPTVPAALANIFISSCWLSKEWQSRSRSPAKPRSRGVVGSYDLMPLMSSVHFLITQSMAMEKPKQKEIESGCTLA